jgi:hypothetical protein
VGMQLLPKAIKEIQQTIERLYVEYIFYKRPLDNPYIVSDLVNLVHSSLIWHDAVEVKFSLLH